MTEEPKSSPSLSRRLFPWILGLLLAPSLGAGLGVAVASRIHMPRVEGIENFQPGLITHIESGDGIAFAEYATERRELLVPGEVPELLENAIVAVEDQAFWSHGGIDLEGVLRAAVTNIRAGRIDQGASTITMQLARNLYLTQRRNWKRKIEEAFLAVELEKRLTKDQILTLYCNIVNLGHGNYGMQAGARAYFGKSVSELTLPEAATLAGIPQRPTGHSPYRNPKGVTKRRNTVLSQMRNVGYISDEQFQEAAATPLEVIRPRSKKRTAAYFSEEVRQHLEKTYGVTELYQGGLTVKTTLDLDIQKAAEKALRDGLTTLDHRLGWRGPVEHLDEAAIGPLEDHALPSWTEDELEMGTWYLGIVLESGRRTARVRIADRELELGADGMAWTKSSHPNRVLKRGDVAYFRLEVPESEAEDEEKTEEEENLPPVLYLEQEPELEGAVMVLESASGAVRALVGGWDFERSKFDRVTQARRQVGSAIKPFVYATALENGFTPADTIFDSPVAFAGADNLPSYSPRNYYRKRYYGIVTLRRALEASLNISSVKLLDMVGAENVIEMARRLGITAPLAPYPTLALGATEILPWEMTAAYAAIANLGLYVEPYLIESITTPDGRLLEENQPRAHKAMEPTTAYLLIHILEGVVDRGTAVKLRDLPLDLAGKTGTTDDYTDAWFVGFTPRYSILTWVGHNKKRSIGEKMTGSEAALPIWRSIVEAGLEQGWIEEGEQFVAPPGVVMANVEATTGLLPGPGAERIIEEAFLMGTEPVRSYDLAWALIMQLPWYQQQSYYQPREGEKMPSDVEDWTLVKDSWKTRDEAGEEGTT